MACSLIHYMYLPKCIAASVDELLAFTIIQTACTGALSWAAHRFFGPLRSVLDVCDEGLPEKSTDSTRAKRHMNLYAGAFFALATVSTNYSVAFGSVASSRMVKSFEPAIAAGFQSVAHMDINGMTPWLFLLSHAVSLMLIVAPRGLTISSALAALCSSAGISARNVCIKLAHKDTSTHRRVETDLNWIASTLLSGAMLPVLACTGYRTFGHTLHALTIKTADVAIAATSFAAFQLAAIHVLQRVTPTRQSAMKSLQSSLLTAMVLLFDSIRSTGRNTLPQLIPAICWAICVSAISLSIKIDIFGDLDECQSQRQVSCLQRRHGGWSIVFCSCTCALVAQSAMMLSTFLSKIRV